MRAHFTKTKVLASASLAVIAVGLAAPAGAAPTQKHHSPQDFLAAVQAAGVKGVAPALLANGYNVCWELWQGGYTADRAASAMQKNWPTLTNDQAARFVAAAHDNLCPVPGAYTWWAYSTS